MTLESKDEPQHVLHARKVFATVAGQVTRNGAVAGLDGHFTAEQLEAIAFLLRYDAQTIEEE